MKAALTELLACLRRVAVDGDLPESVFLEQVGALGLRDAERGRLRKKLAGLGLPVLGRWCMQTVTVRMRKRLHESVKKMCPPPPLLSATSFGRC